MLRTVASKAIWVGRTTSIVFGLALAMALVLGVATMALAAVPGDPFKLGRINSVNKVSALVGTVASPMLRVENKGTGTALNLRVQQDKAPMTVNSTGRVPKLNSDMVDGKHAGAFLPKGGTAADSAKLEGEAASAFFSGKTYLTKGGTAFFSNGNSGGSGTFCDEGDVPLVAGYSGIDPAAGGVTEITPTTFPPNPHRLGVMVQAKSLPGETLSVTAHLLCGDLGEVHQP